MTTYTHVRFEPRNSIGFRAYDNQGSFLGIVSLNVFSTALEEDAEGNGIIRTVTFEELTDIQRFMQELQEEGK